MNRVRSMGVGALMTALLAPLGVAWAQTQNGHIGSVQSLVSAMRLDQFILQGAFGTFLLRRSGPKADENDQERQIALYRCLMSSQTESISQVIAGTIADKIHPAEAESALAFYRGVSGKKLVQVELVDMHRMLGFDVYEVAPSLTQTEEAEVSRFKSTTTFQRLEAVAGELRTRQGFYGAVFAEANRLGKSCGFSLDGL
jgi:hypothetical protein